MNKFPLDLSLTSFICFKILCHAYYFCDLCHSENKRPQENETGIRYEKWEMMSFGLRNQIVNKPCASLSCSDGCDWRVDESVIGHTSEKGGNI